MAIQPSLQENYGLLTRAGLRKKEGKSVARKWIIYAYKGFEGLQLVDCSTEEPGPNGVRLRIELFALN